MVRHFVGDPSEMEMWIMPNWVEEMDPSMLIIQETFLNMHVTASTNKKDALHRKPFSIDAIVMQIFQFQTQILEGLQIWRHFPHNHSHSFGISTMKYKEHPISMADCPAAGIKECKKIFIVQALNLQVEHLTLIFLQGQIKK